jgi:hypothetical protein
MSSTVFESGKLVPLDIEESTALAICKERGIDVDSYFFDTPFEALACETNDYAIVEGLGFCRVEDFESKDPSDMCELTANEDGSYNFRIIYYDGGAYWTEVVEAGLKKLV